MMLTAQLWRQGRRRSKIISRRIVPDHEQQKGSIVHLQRYFLAVGAGIVIGCPDAFNSKSVTKGMLIRKRGLDIVSSALIPPLIVCHGKRKSKNIRLQVIKAKTLLLY